MAHQCEANFGEERLERLEREARRRQWDSTVAAVKRVARDDRAGPPALLPVDLLTERLNHLERAIDRLERDHRQWVRVRHCEAQARRRCRFVALAILAAALCAAGVAQFAGLPHLGGAASSGLRSKGDVLD
ncbi:MAG: hypothetical protein IRY99_27780 [Isosphaeraceae bacterium]|nr:hypothetical protein [Isosphaeraceae bacterium]